MFFHYRFDHQLKLGLIELVILLQRDKLKFKFQREKMFIFNDRQCLK